MDDAKLFKSFRVYFDTCCSVLDQAADALEICINTD
jgi:hypothetical protein